MGSWSSIIFPCPLHFLYLYFITSSPSFWFFFTAILVEVLPTVGGRRGARAWWTTRIAVRRRRSPSVFFVAPFFSFIRDFTYLRYLSLEDELDDELDRYLRLLNNHTRTWIFSCIRDTHFSSAQAYGNSGTRHWAEGPWICGVSPQFPPWACTHQLRFHSFPWRLLSHFPQFRSPTMIRANHTINA